MVTRSEPSTPIWQTERANRLHRACLSLQSAISAGEKTSKALRRVAQRHHARKFTCDPSRRLQLSALTLRRAWNVWRQNGQQPSAFRLNYRPANVTVAAPVLVRFAKFCASFRFASMAEAWRLFSARAGSFGCGPRRQSRQKISYQQVCRYFPAADFHQMQSHLRAIQVAQLDLAKLRFHVTANLRRQLPDQLPARKTRNQL